MTLNPCPVDRLSFLTLPPSSGWRRSHTPKKDSGSDSAFQSRYRTFLSETAPWAVNHCSRITLFLLRLMIAAPKQQLPHLCQLQPPPTPTPSPTTSIIHAHLLRVQLPDLLMQVRLELISSKSGFYVSTSSLLF